MAAQVFNLERRNQMDYHVMTRELYPHGYLLETRGFFANDKQARPHSSACTGSFRWALAAARI